MKERPILLGGDWVRRILAGEKTQTRRPIFRGGSPEHHMPWRCRDHWQDGDDPLTCPWSYGDRLWVRETWSPIPETKPSGYFTDPKWIDRVAWYAADNDKPTWGGKWRPSIHMPRWASRLELRVVEVGAERLQDMSRADAVSEGINSRNPVRVFAKAWDSIYGARGEDEESRGQPWRVNEWVWVCSFRVANIKAGRIVGGGDGWDGVVDALGLVGPGVYDVSKVDATPVAVATVRNDGTWRIEGGKRHGRDRD